MHETLIQSVKSNIDVNTFRTIKGWAFSIMNQVHPIRLVVNDNIIFEAKSEERPDVVSYYNNPFIKTCGFIVEYILDCSLESKKIKRELQIYLNDNWVTFKVFEELIYTTFGFEDNKYFSFLVVDNFYKNPHEVREFALKQTFNYHPTSHKGKRTEVSNAPNGIKEHFEKILGRKITKWNEYMPVNGCFQVCNKDDKLVYHADTQNYAGIIYLTPDAPPNSGTSFYRSKHTLKMKAGVEEYGIVYPNGHLEGSDFEMVDTVGNVFNRLVLFDAQFIHAATSYFGDSDDNCRLFQMFFFDIEQ